MKYTKAVVRAIVELTETTDLTIQKICDKVGIGKSTYYDWFKAEPEFSDALKVADEKRLDEMKAVARQMAFKKLKGYSVNEVKTEQDMESNGIGKERRYFPVTKRVTKTRRHIVGSDTLIMYLLNNTDSDNFKHKEHHDLTTKGKKVVAFDFSKMSTKELLKRAKAIELLEKNDG